MAGPSHPGGVAPHPTPAARREARLAITGYLTVAGYREMFISAGFEKAVAAAPTTERWNPHFRRAPR